MDNKQQQEKDKEEQKRKELEGNTEQNARRSNASEALSTSTSQAAIEANLVQQLEQQTTAVSEAQANLEIQQVIEDNRPLIEEIEDQYNNNYDQIAEKYNPEEMRSYYQTLNRVMQVLLIFLILVLVCVVGWGTWHLISFLWPHLVAFIEKHGQTILIGMGHFLQSLSNTPQIGKVDESFKTLAMPSSSSSAVADLPIDPANATPIVTQSGSQAILLTLQLLYQFLRTRFGGESNSK